MDVLDLIASDNFIPVNRTLAKEIGLEVAILFGALCGYQRHYKGEEFYREQDKLIEDTCLTEYSIRQATKVLKELGLINVIKKGLPAKNYYKVNQKRLIELLSTSGYENNTTRDSENNTTRSIEISTTNNKTNNKTENKNNNNIYTSVCDYLNEKAETNFRASSKNTQSHINARLRDGFTLDDFKRVIDNKVSQWKNDRVMCQYLRPETLFGNKFESYLNEKITARKSDKYTKEQINTFFTDLDDIKI